MDKDTPILFNHIPKTGGTTLRIVFNRIYGSSIIFFLKSKNIEESVLEFKELSSFEREKYKVISGHGSMYLESSLKKPFIIASIREPQSLFLSQFEYLRKSTNSIFLKEVSKLKTIDEYLQYAILKGQDNLLVRYFSETLDFLIDSNKKIPKFSENGEELLEKAKSNLKKYDLIIDLKDFDKGVFLLSQLLKWPKIPFYRPFNRTKYEASQFLNSETKEKINDLLQWDIELYRFITENYHLRNYGFKKSFKSSVFVQKQKIIESVTKLMRKY